MGFPVEVSHLKTTGSERLTGLLVSGAVKLNERATGVNAEIQKKAGKTLIVGVEGGCGCMRYNQYQEWRERFGRWLAELRCR